MLQANIKQLFIIIRYHVLDLPIPVPPLTLLSLIRPFISLRVYLNLSSLIQLLYLYCTYFLGTLHFYISMRRSCTEIYLHSITAPTIPSYFSVYLVIVNFKAQEIGMSRINENRRRHETCCLPSTKITECTSIHCIFKVNIPHTIATPWLSTLT